VPFRLHSLHEILACYRVMFALDFTADVPWRLLVAVGAATVLALGVGQNSNEIPWETRGLPTATALGLATFVTLLYMNASTRFLYFQF